MNKFTFLIISVCFGVLSQAQAPSLSENSDRQPPTGFTTQYSIIAVNWDKFLGECEIQAVSKQTIYYIYAKQALWGKNCSHLPGLNSTVWGSEIKHHHGNGDQIRLVYSTDGGKVSCISYFLNRMTPYKEK